MSLKIINRKKNPIIAILIGTIGFLVVSSIYFFTLINNKEIEKIKAFKPTSNIPYEIKRIKKFIPENKIINFKTDKNNIIFETTDREIELSPLMARYEKKIKVSFEEKEKYIISIPISEFKK